MKTKYLFLACIFALFSSCSTIYTSSDFDRKTNFNTFKTFSIHEKGFSELKLNDIDKNRVRNNIVSNLTSRGFTQVNDNSDFIINVQAFNKEKVNIDYNNFGFGGFGGFGWGPGWGLGWNFGMNDPRVSQYQEGTLVISIVNTKDNILVWEGIAAGIMIERNNRKEVQIPEAINKVMNKFPPTN